MYGLLAIARASRRVTVFCSVSRGVWSPLVPSRFALARPFVVLRESYWQTLFLKALSNFCRNLAIRHLVNSFDTNDAATEFFALKSFSELDLCLTRTEY